MPFVFVRITLPNGSMGLLRQKTLKSKLKILEQRGEGGDGTSAVRIKLCGKECKIRFKEKHLLDLQEMVKVSDSGNALKQQ